MRLDLSIEIPGQSYSVTAAITASYNTQIGQDLENLAGILYSIHILREIMITDASRVRGRVRGGRNWRLGAVNRGQSDSTVDIQMKRNIA